MDVSTWLRDLGLENYVQAFQAHDIDAEVLPRLTADDLTALGITSVGHRRKLLDAIAALNQERGPAAAEPTTVAAQPLEAERRQLTVLFCDLVDSTELASRLDPEDLREVMRAYQAACANVVCRFEGHVARFLGDGVLAYFGWPRAHEDDAERAVRTGLQLVQDIARLEPPAEVRLQARVGVATGHVVVGDLISGGSSDKDAVSGDTPNLAARLQALAAPGSVVISQATRRLVGGLFELADLGPVRLKGFAEPLSAFRVEGKGHAEGRFDALHGEHLTPLVGREHELGILLERWSWARDGDGQVVLLAGEPGIGKSRLLRTLRERLGDDTYTPLSHYCSPHHTNSALYPVIDLLERTARLERNAPPEEQLAKLEAVLARSSDRPDEVVPLLAALLGVSTGERYPALALTPEAQKRRTLQALVDQLAGLAAQQPVLALYEDVHWVDPSTLEFLGLVIDRIQRLPVLALITFRPEFQPPWTGQAHVTTLTMSRLGRRQGAELVGLVTGDKPLPAEIVAEIVAKTDGVPLFVEELTKTVLESGLLADAGDHYELHGPLPPFAIPTTLHDSLMARLDRLAPVKEVAQVGAVIGREFSHDLLAAVSPLCEPDLSSALDQLITSELIFRRGAPPDATYSFKHALVQDAAYQSLLKSKRQQVHARIAKVLEEQFPATAEARPEVVAHHCTHAGLTGKATDYRYKAGRQAMARSAMTEAVAQLTQGLDLLATLSVGPDRDHKELNLRIALGAALISTQGWAALEVGKTYARARELCTSEAQISQLLAALYGLFVHHLHRSSKHLALQIAGELLRFAERRQDVAAQAVGHRAWGLGLMLNGQLLPALTHFERALALYDPADRISPVYLWGSDTRVSTLLFSAWILLFQGYPDRALRRSREALAAVDELGHAYTTSQALYLTCWLHQIRGDQRLVRERAAAVMALATENGLSAWAANGTVLHGWAVANGGATEAGIAQLRRGLAAKQAMGVQLHTPGFLGLLAGLYIGIKSSGEALKLLNEALALVDRIDERWFEAELRRLKGEALLGCSPERAAEAEACYHQALAVARDQGARLWELRAATSLARLWRDQGKRQQAIDLLAPVYGWFTEGFDTQDLQDAKALLDELGPTPTSSVA
jgi:class 3 adenylate cyclase/predicted ATPase